MNKNTKYKSKYNHFETSKKILLGVDKSITAEEVSILVDAPLIMYDKDVFAKVMQLGANDRNVIISSLDIWIKKK